LQLALNAWKEDIPDPEVKQGPQLHLIDAERDRRRLVAFTILGDVPQQGMRGFEAELQFADVDQAERREYVIVGIDPLWVFRKEDLEMLAHWDHPMSPPPAEPDEPEAAAGEPAGAPSDE
jgi:hypothetical protein